MTVNIAPQADHLGSARSRSQDRPSRSPRGRLHVRDLTGLAIDSCVWQHRQRDRDSRRRLRVERHQQSTLDHDHVRGEWERERHGELHRRVDERTGRGGTLTIAGSIVHGEPGSRMHVLSLGGPALPRLRGRDGHIRRQNRRRLRMVSRQQRHLADGHRRRHRHWQWHASATRLPRIAGPQRTGTMIAGGQTFTVTRERRVHVLDLATSQNVGNAADRPRSRSRSRRLFVERLEQRADGLVSRRQQRLWKWHRAADGRGQRGSEPTRYRHDRGRDIHDRSVERVHVLALAERVRHAGVRRVRFFAVNTNPSCAWTAVANAPWLSVTSGTSGNGPGTVAFVACQHRRSTHRHDYGWRADPLPSPRTTAACVGGP